MSDKLIDLIKRGGVIIPETAEAVADYLIENNVLILPEKMKDSWELTSAFVLRLFCANEEEVSKIKKEFELQKVKQILTDIRDYLVSWRDNNAIDYSAERWIDETALADLTEYAEKLGVEL